MTFSEFLHMGGYAFYVWTSYGIVALVLILNFTIPILRRRNLLKQIKRQLRRDQVLSK